MDVFLKKIVVGAGIYLKPDEALRFVRDPRYQEEVARQVGGMLTGSGIDLETGEQRPGILEGAVAGAFGVPALAAPAGASAHDRAVARRGAEASAMARRAVQVSLADPHAVDRAERALADGSRTCPDCRREFSTPGRMRAHVTQTHAKGRPGKPLRDRPCPECGALFASERAVAIHRGQMHKGKAGGDG